MNEQNEEKENKEKQGNSTMREVLDWVKHIAIALVIAFLISRYVIVNAHVPTPSMETTIMVKDRLIANRLQYLFKDPQRGDIIVFKYPDDESWLYVKRVIGLPGDTVLIKNGETYINDKKLDEPYLREPMIGNFGPYKVPEGQYFVMGDNRNNSKDSRYWQNKFVSKEKILGKAIFQYYPKFKIF